MYKILLADDEGIVTDALQFIIEKNFGNECEIAVAKNGRQAIELTESFQPDIAFLDIQMPGINGLKAMKEIREQNSRIKIIVLTAYDNFEYAKDALHLGAEEYLLKPINKKVIVERLTALMRDIDQSRKKRSEDLKIKAAAATDSSKEAETKEGEALTGEPIKIGTIYAMSGGSAAIGTNILRGIDFAVEEINAAGGVNGRPLEVVRGDHAGDAATGRSEAERLITQEKVDVMMGCHMSVVTEVVAQVCQQYKVPMITAISTLDRLSNADHKDMDYFFRLCPLNSVYVEDMLKYLQDSKEQTGEEIKTVAIFTDRAAIGQELIRCVELFKDEYGIDLVATVDYTSNATDLSAQVLALKQADPDAILCDSYIGDATLFIQTLKEQNYSPKMIVAKANGFTDPSFITNLGAISNGVASVVEFNPDLVNGVEINKEFKDEFGVDMNGHSACVSRQWSANARGI